MTEKNGLQLSTQLDIESTIRILEVCLKNLKGKASLKQYQLERKQEKMIKEDKKVGHAVKEVKVVLAVLKEYLDKKADMPYEVIKNVVQKLNNIEEDYDATIKELSASTSLVIKLEKLYDIIGAIGTISIEDEEKLDKTLNILDKYVESLRD